MKKIAIVDESLNNLLTSYFQDKAEIIVTENLDDFNADILVLSNYSGNIPDNIFESAKVLNLHPALLPAFKNNNALIQAFTSGIKVSGVTVHYVEKDNFYGKIIAQYPLMIDSSMHYNEYVERLTNIGSKIYPRIIESVLQDKVFDFSDMFNNSCSGKCNSCGGCHR